MSQESLKDFLHSVSHNLQLRKKFLKCSNPEEIIFLAKEYRFTVSKEDLSEENSSEHINAWFHKSKISPIRTN